MADKSEHETLAEFLRGQAASGDFAHDRERFVRAADLLQAAAEAAQPPAAPATEDTPITPAPDAKVPA
jgi:hypothetical protein